MTEKKKKILTAETRFLVIGRVEYCRVIFGPEGSFKVFVYRWITDWPTVPYSGPQLAPQRYGGSCTSGWRYRGIFRRCAQKNNKEKQVKTNINTNSGGFFSLYDKNLLTIKKKQKKTWRRTTRILTTFYVCTLVFVMLFK